MNKLTIKEVLDDFTERVKLTYDIMGHENITKYLKKEILSLIEDWCNYGNATLEKIRYITSSAFFHFYKRVLIKLNKMYP